MEKGKKKIIESIPNYSEGSNGDKIEEIVKEIKNTPNTRIVDIQYDSDYNRAVISFVGTPEAVLKANVAAAKIAATYAILVSSNPSSFFATTTTYIQVEKVAP